MPKSVTIQGLSQVQNSLNALPLLINKYMGLAMESLAKKVVTVAKDKCERDTGALQDSIHHEMTKATDTEIQESIIAGDDNIVRGEGNYSWSKKHGGFVTPTPTTEYAAIHEEQQGYMANAHQWAEGNASKELGKSLKVVLK